MKKKKRKKKLHLYRSGAAEDSTGPLHSIIPYPIHIEVVTLTVQGNPTAQGPSLCTALAKP